jgi:tRNA dimethylallyltransferase
VKGGLERICEIISADSRQIYRHMTIGTDKISEEIRNEIPHHLIDIVNPDERYTAGQWKQDTAKIISEIHARGNVPMIVGGTGLYIDTIYKNFAMSEVQPQMERRNEMMEKEDAEPGFLFRLLQSIDPEEAQKHHENSLRYVLRALEIHHFTGKTKSEQAQQQPVQWPLFMIGLWREKEETNRRINARIKEMFAGGLVNEVRGLLEQYGPNAPGMQAIGYKEIV